MRSPSSIMDSIGAPMRTLLADVFCPHGKYAIGGEVCK